MPKTDLTARCPALFLAAPSSGQGKTTVTAALARLLKRQGLNVRVFKTGPDYLDPQILAQASGAEVAPLDLWMAGEAYCQQQLFDAATEADFILVEGAMGLFDGEPSSADLAAKFGIPMALLMDVKGMAQTAAAIAIGLSQFRDDVEFAGLLANNCGSERHAQLIRDALPESLPLLATFKRDESVALPERHLGLVQASEAFDDIEQRLEAGADWLANSFAAEGIALNDVSSWAKSVEFTAPEQNPCVLAPELASVLAGKTIGIAKDAAFSFIYSANEALLQDMGASLTYFSPISDTRLPAVDALWLPGGYPELHTQALAQNTPMLEAIRRHVADNKPVFAECGGFLYCLDTLTDLAGDTHHLLGVLAGEGAMRGKRGCQGMQILPLPEGDIQAHAHHRSRATVSLAPIAHGTRQRHPAPGEAVYRQGSITASYLHGFFPSNPQAVAALFGAASH